MSSDGAFNLKSATAIFAALVIGLASSEGQPGGKFDLLTKINRKKTTVISSQTPVVLASNTIVAATPAPPTTLSSNSLYPELSIIPSNFDVSSELVTTPPATVDATSPVGAFRFLCNPGQVIRDDPIVYPGQVGKSHLHQFFGNMDADANSTYSSLRSHGNSTCMSPLNRSAYWMPAMLDGKGSVVRPDWVSIYYKRRPQSDPKCSLTSGDPQAEGNCVPLPNGLRMIFGFNMLNPASPPTGNYHFSCLGQTAGTGSYANLAEELAHCPTAKNPDGSYNKLGAILDAPPCWDGKNLDSPNHRDHVAYPGYGSWGYLKCPSTHPFVIPNFTMGAWYTVDANLGTWHLSSDEMHPELPAGTTFHGDWFGAWDNTTEQTWMDNCINKLLNCSAGNLGNGTMMKMWPGFNWFATPRLVPIPA